MRNDYKTSISVDNHNSVDSRLLNVEHSTDNEQKMNFLRFIIVVLTIVISCVNCYFVKPGPQVIATKGEIWPKPKQQTIYSTFSVIRPSTLNFEVSFFLLSVFRF